jgi:polysaccharide pyruvyl transferase WcaK-like protein
MPLENKRMTHDPTRPKIVLFGTFGTGNLGNECTLRAILHNLRRYLPESEVMCICSGPEETASSYGISAFPIRFTVSIRKILSVRPSRNNAAVGPPNNVTVGLRNNAIVELLRNIIKLPLEPYRWYKAFRILRGADMLVLAGLGMLGDFGIRPLGLHYDILRWSIIAKLCRCKVLFVSVGVGPIRDPLSRCFVKAALALADYRSYRDTFSKDYLEGIGFNAGADSVYPDLVFSLPKAMLPDSGSIGGRRAVIGVGLLNYYSRRGRSEDGETIYVHYLANIAALVIRLLEQGHVVRLLIGDFVYDQGVRMDLKKLLEDRGWRYESAKIIDEPASSIEEILSQLASTDLVVASRFHNLLLALMLGKPVVALSYHEKIETLLGEVGMSEYCQDIEDIDVNKLCEHVTNLEAHPEKWKHPNGIQQLAETYRGALDEQYDRIFRCLPRLSGSVDCPIAPT